MFDVLKKFDEQYRALDVRTVEEMGRWFSDRYNNDAVTMTTNGSVAAGPAATMSVVSMEDCDLKFLNWGAQVSGKSSEGMDVITVTLPLTGSSEFSTEQFGALNCANTQGVICRRDSGTVVSSPAGTSKVVLSMPASLLEDAARNYTSVELSNPLQFSPNIDLAGGTGLVVKNLFAHILSCAVVEPTALKNSLVGTGLRDHLISTLVSVLPHNYSDIGAGLCERDTTPRHVRLAEEYMRAHPDEAISLATLSQKAGCSARTLQNSFKAHRGQTPIAVLRDIRLEYVRRDLSTLEDSTVTEIAFKWGFSHLGRFAIAYAAKFSEKPSETALAKHKISAVRGAEI